MNINLGDRIELAGRTYIVGRFMPHFSSGDLVVQLTDATQDKTNQGIVWAAIADVEASLPGKQAENLSAVVVAEDDDEGLEELFDDVEGLSGD